MVKKVMGTGMNREEILLHSDNTRRQICEHIAEVGQCTLGYLSNLFDVSNDQMRCYIRYLIKMNNIQLVNIKGKMSYYIATGVPYETIPVLQRMQANKLKEQEKEGAIIPGARIIRLLDKKPEPLTKSELRHKRLRTSSLGLRGSSMSLFDNF